MRFLGFELRRATAYPDVLALEDAAKVSDSTAAQAVAAVEIAAGFLGRAFATARLVPEVAAVTPSVLELIGRRLVTRGECVHAIDLDTGMLRLTPVSDWDITGPADPREHVYRCDLQGPSRNQTRRFLSPSVVHVRANVDGRAPWKGVSPITHASLSAELLAKIEKALIGETAVPLARVAPGPAAAETSNQLADRLSKGGVSVVPADGGMDSRSRYDITKMQPDPAGGMVTLRGDVAGSILLSCGIPNELTRATDGGASREAWRHFLFGTAAPLGRLVEAELADKLDVPGLHLDWTDLQASDLSGRARALQSMVGAGMDLDRAAALSGLLQPEE